MLKAKIRLNAKQLLNCNYAMSELSCIIRTRYIRILDKIRRNRDKDNISIIIDLGIFFTRT